MELAEFHSGLGVAGMERNPKYLQAVVVLVLT
jgi:hypothetical protein